MYNNTLQSEADYEMPMDQNDFNLKIQGNVANGNAFLKRIEITFFISKLKFN